LGPSDPTHEKLASISLRARSIEECLIDQYPARRSTIFSNL
jgi:hypothetical protein